MFEVGQRIVCIGLKGTPKPPGFWEAWCRHWGVVLPVRGTVYTVRDARLGSVRQHLRLIEIVNPPVDFRDAPKQEPWFWADGFRPIVERKTSIAVFQALLDRAKEPA